MERPGVRKPVLIGLLLAALLLTAGPTEGAVTFRSKNQVIGSGTSPTVTEPASCASGDALIALALTPDTGNPAKPAGWTDLYSGTLGSGAVGVDWLVSYIIRGSSAPSLTWTITGSVYREVHVLCLTGAAALVLDSQSSTGGTYTATLNTTDPDPPSTTAVASSSMAVAGALHWAGSSAAWTASTGYTIRTQNTGGTNEDGVMETKSVSASGAENPSAILGTGTVNSSAWHGFTVTFAEDSGGGGAAATPRHSLLGVGD